MPKSSRLPRQPILCQPSHSARCLEDYEFSVFMNACHFTVNKVVPRESKLMEQHLSLPAALRSARSWRGPYGRQAMVYAVTPQSDSNHFVHLSRNKWEHLLALWNEGHPLNRATKC